MLGQLPSEPQRKSARHDGDFVDRISLRQELGNNRMTGLVISGIAALLFAHDSRFALGSHDNLVFRIFEILHLDQTLVAARCKQGRLIDEIGEIGTREARCATREDVGLHVRCDRHLAHVYIENLFATANVWQTHNHLTIETTRAQQRLVQHVGAVGCCNNDHTGIGFKSVHLNQQLVQGLLALIVTAARAGTAMTTHCINFIDKNNARRMLFRILEHVTYTRCTNTHKHLNEVGTRDAEERNPSFTGNCLSNKSLTRSRRAVEQNSARNLRTEGLELLGLL